MERKFYNELKAQKEAGIKLDWDNVGRTELIQLWWRETIFDEKIADLFGVPASEVKRKRYDLGIKQQDMIYHDVMSDVYQRIKGIDYDDQFEPCDHTDRVKKILGEIKELSLEERNALIMAGKTDIFADIYADASFGHRLSIVLTQRVRSD